MGIGGISIWQLLIILAIVLLVFGTKRLKNMGGDLGGAIRGFKKAMNDDKPEQTDADKEATKDQQTIETSEATEPSTHSTRQAGKNAQDS